MMEIERTVNEFILKCNNCKSGYLHQYQTDVFERSEEEDAGMHTMILHGLTSVDGNMTGNPSSRRHGLTVRCTCEECDHETILSIYQHKGATIMGARSVAEPMSETSI